VQAQPAKAPEAFHSPSKLDELEKLPGIRLVDKVDHKEIVYPNISASGKIYKVTERRWEDGSDFEVSTRGKQIFRLREASPYWGYASGKNLKFYFVDDDPTEPGARKYGDLTYKYIYLDVSGDASKAVSCKFNLRGSKRADLAELLARTIDENSENPVPQLISKILSEGVRERRQDHCLPFRDVSTSR
jgi:hypothetical protein